MGTWTPAIQRINDLGIDCTYRQLDYWCRLGHLGDAMAGNRSGWRREFTSVDLEVLHAVNETRKISQRVPLDRAAEIVRARPVDPTGEVLVIDADGDARRFDHWCAVAEELLQPEPRPVCVIPLRSFAATSTPAGSRDVLPTGNPAAGSGDGRHRPSASVPANHAPT